MFFRYLKKLQSLPTEKKQVVALFASVMITAMVFGFWLATFQLSNKTAAEETAATSPFGTIANAFNGLAEELANRFGEFSDQISNFQKTEVWNSYSSSTTVQQTFEIK